MAKKTASEKLVDIGKAPEVKGPASVWTGMLTFGLISLPIRLHTGARGEHIAFNQLHADCLVRIKQQLYCPACDKVVERDELVKGYEYRKGEYVVVDKKELQECEPASADTLDIREFVDAAEIDPIYFESSYYVTPQDGGQRAYGLIRAAMLRTGKVGISQIAMHGREHIVIIRPYDKGIALHTLYYKTEVRDIAYPALDAGNEQEQKVAGQLIEALSAEFEPARYSDGYAEGVKALIASRIEGTPAPKKTKATKKSEAALSILDAMKASIAQAQKKKKVA